MEVRPSILISSWRLVDCKITLNKFKSVFSFSSSVHSPLQYIHLDFVQIVKFDWDGIIISNFSLL